MGNIDCQHLKWIEKPKLYFGDEEKLTLEAGAFTFWRNDSDRKQCPEAQLTTHGNFIFNACTEFVYSHPFDQCGFILYNGDVKKAVFGTEKKNDEYLRLVVNVFNTEGGDRSMRDVGAALGQIYYRVIYRGGACTIQYSFAGTRYTDLREFQVDPAVGITAVSMYACSPYDSYVDCTFRDLNLREDRMIEETKE